jgi:hypothetical protein
MNSSTAPVPLSPEDLGDPAVIVAHGSRPGRIHLETAKATREQRRALAPVLAFFRTLRKPPESEPITITLADPILFALILTGRLRVDSLDLVERLVGLGITLPDDRFAASAPVLDWWAHFRDKLRRRLKIRQPD